MPESISGAGGAIKLNAKEDQRRSKTQVEKKMCECWDNDHRNYISLHNT
jgi:hypothetical protein